MHYKSPTYNIDSKEWSYTEFATRKETVVYIDNQVKYPGEYFLKYTQGYWNEQGIIWQKTGSYPMYLHKSLDFKKHWDSEKEKCNMEGFVIYKKPSENIEFAVPGLMYWYLNYCPIEDKLKKKIDLPEIYDGDYHYFLYILRCLLRRKFGVVLKKRQCIFGNTVISTDKGDMTIKEMVDQKYQGHIYSFDPITLQRLDDTVLRAVEAKKVSKFITIHTESNHFIQCSIDHRIYDKNRGWVRADELVVGNVLFVKGSESKIKEILLEKGDVQLYDIETEKYNSFFANGIYVHNSGYTLKNMAILLNAIWFGNAAISKIFAHDESKVLDSWKLMENYRDHINRHCGWKRGFDPGKKLDWLVRRKKKDGSYGGNMSAAKGFTTKSDPTNGIGGNATIIFAEESGQNPTLDISHEFITSNVALGGLVTGLIIYSGAVGQLEKAEPLKNFIINAKDNNFLTCPNNIEDDLEFGKEVGFFAPEWWNYVAGTEAEEGEDNFGGEVRKYYDEWGNSDKEGALISIMHSRKQAQSKKPEKYRFYCSQRPLSIKEAFAVRKESRFPAKMLEAQRRRIEAKEYPTQYVELSREENGKISYKQTEKLPIKTFPVDPKMEDKTGVVVMHEKPMDNPQFAVSYYASIDPVGEGKSTSSESLCSIQVYKNDVEITKVTEHGTTVYVEHGKIVATWCGRFDDINKTHERLLMIMELYNAWTLVEANISHFIQYCIAKRKQYYLVPKNQIVFLKELGANENVFQEYGWKNTGVLFEKHLLDYGIEFLKEELDHEVKEDGEIVKTVYGVERIPDIMLITEMEAYYKGLNVDRLVSYCALVSFVKMQQANRGLAKRVEKSELTKKSDKDLYKPTKSAFKHMGGNSSSTKNPYRNPFKNLR